MKGIRLSFEVGIQVEQTDANWLETTLLAGRERRFREGLLTVLRQIEAWALDAWGPCPPAAAGAGEPLQRSSPLAS